MSIASVSMMNPRSGKGFAKIGTVVNLLFNVSKDSVHSSVHSNLDCFSQSMYGDVGKTLYKAAVVGT